MARPRRKQKRPEPSHTPAWRGNERCIGCGKRCYETKAAARTASRIKHPDDHMSVYQCRSEHPELPNPAPWHMGHLADEIREGSLSREAVYDRNKRLLTGDTERCDVEGCKREESEHAGPCLTKDERGDWMLLVCEDNDTEDGDNPYGNRAGDSACDALQGQAG